MKYITFAVPCYNSESYMEHCINSLLVGGEDVEIIIVNDCSTDNSINLFNYLLNEDPRIRIFHHMKNMGCWRSRLDGILYSRGK